MHVYLTLSMFIFFFSFFINHEQKMKNKFIILILISLILNNCVGVSSTGIFGTGVSVAIDPRSLGTQIDDSIMQKNLAARVLILDKKYLLSIFNRGILEIVSLLKAINPFVGSKSSQYPVDNFVRKHRPKFPKSLKSGIFINTSGLLNLFPFVNSALFSRRGFINSGINAGDIWPSESIFIIIPAPSLKAKSIHVLVAPPTPLFLE